MKDVLKHWDRETLPWQFWKIARPLVGGLAGMAIVIAFLALRGGEPGEVDPLTGTERGGWSRPEDVHLLITVIGAATVGLLVTLLGEWVRHWGWILRILAVGGVLLIVREGADIDGAGAEALLSLIFLAVFLAVAVALYDLKTVHRRSGY